MKIDQKAALNY